MVGSGEVNRVDSAEGLILHRMHHRCGKNDINVLERIERKNRLQNLEVSPFVWDSTRESELLTASDRVSKQR